MKVQGYIKFIKFYKKNLAHVWQCKFVNSLTHHKLTLRIGKTFKETEWKSKHNEEKAKVKRQKQNKTTTKKENRD